MNRQGLHIARMRRIPLAPDGAGLLLGNALFICKSQSSSKNGSAKF
jgi:hypothetical protein